MEFFWFVVPPLVASLPVYLVWSVALAATWIRRQALPGAWPLVIAGLFILLVSSIGGNLAAALVPQIMPPGSASFSANAMGQVLLGLNLVRSLAAAIGHALILVALFRLARTA